MAEENVNPSWIWTIALKPSAKNLAKSAFSSLKQRTKVFFNNITLNPEHNEGIILR